MMAARYSLLQDGSFRVTYDSPEENPNFGECGNSIDNEGGHVTLKELGPASVEKFERDMPQHIEMLHQMAREKLPPGTVYDIRGKIPSDYGRSRGVAWYHVDAMKDWPVTGPIPYPGTLNGLGGYMQLGTFRTPG
jgi:hypothetical protein